jgi:hypothetical protein
MSPGCRALLVFFRGLENPSCVSSFGMVLNFGPKVLVIHWLDMLPSQNPFLP